jgi:glycerol-3-phosphate dehydrogenase
LKVYDVLAGKYGFGKSRHLSREETLEQLPTIRQDGLKGGVRNTMDSSTTHGCLPT